MTEEEMSSGTRDLSVWCCERKERCRWQGFALNQGLGWGTVRKSGAWREWHDRECGGRLIQLTGPDGRSVRGDDTI